MFCSSLCDIGPPDPHTPPVRYTSLPGVWPKCLHGTFMTKLRVFTVRADAESKWEAGRAPNNMTWLLLSPESPAQLSRSIRPRGSDDDSPACKARRGVCPVLSEVSTRTASSTIVSSVTSYVGTATSYDSPVPKPRSALYGGLPCPVFAGGDSAISVVPGFPCFKGLCRSGRLQFRMFSIK